MKTLTTPLLLALLLLLPRCSTQSVAGGGGSDIEVYGRAFGNDGEPVGGALVRLRHSDFVAALPALARNASVWADATTDNDGRFVLRGITPGAYRIEVYDNQSASAVLHDIDLGDEPTGTIGALYLQPWATVIGTLNTPAPLSSRRYVQVYGLERLIPVDSSGHFAITDLPAGNLVLRVIAPNTASAPALVSDSIVVTPGDTVVAPPIQWSGLSRVYLNTTPAGADIAENVFDFPVLIRLDSTEIDFSQCQDSGQDIRFYTTSGNLMYHEIELWEPSNNRAIIWVRVDTIHAHSDAQHFTMRWGGSGTNDVSEIGPVFDTALGYAGVWHMQPTAHSTIEDASAYGNTGSAARMETADGQIGNAVLFSGADAPIHCGTHYSLQAADTMTISAWVSVSDPSKDRYMRVLSKKRELFDSAGYELECNAVLSSRTEDDRSTVTFLGMDTSWARGYTTLSAEWHLITVVIAGDSSYVYCDGRNITTRTNRSYRGVHQGDAPLFIGGASFGDLFYGRIDEVRIMKALPSAAFLRLCHENQKRNQTLVTLIGTATPK